MHTITLDTNNDGRFGNYLESLFGIPENNRKGSDLPGIELKTKVSKSAHITLFSKEPDYKALSTFDMICEYGSLGKLNARVKSDHIWNNLFVTISNNCIEVYDELKDIVICSWTRESIEERIIEKIQNIELYNVTDYGSSFSYDSKDTYTGTSYERFIELVKQGLIVIDFRMKFGKNRGTAFRIYKKYMDDLYNTNSYQVLT